MAKKDATARKGWLGEWCTSHAPDLVRYQDKTVALHPDFGVVFVDDDEARVYTLMAALKKRIRKETIVASARQLLLNIGLAEAEEAVEEEEAPAPPLAPPPDPFDNLEPGDVGTFNPKPEDKGTPFPSPDPQPPFRPHRHNGGGFDPGVLIDGGGQAWRNRSTRID
jgi:hypothetical protein